VPGINYETVFIAEPEIPTEQVDQLIAKIKDTITTHKGSVTAEDRWGRRRLAYPLRGFREGFYTVMTFTAEPTVIVALEHLYNVSDSVIRQLTIKVIKSNKKFRPRRERPAGEMHRSGPGGRMGSGPRRPLPTVTPPPPINPPAASQAPVQASAPTTEAPAAPPAQPAPAPQGDKP
jgi:small subunit ribosomal protein S6